MPDGQRGCYRADSIASVTCSTADSSGTRPTAEAAATFARRPGEPPCLTHHATFPWHIDHGLAADPTLGDPATPAERDQGRPGSTRDNPIRRARRAPPEASETVASITNRRDDPDAPRALVRSVPAVHPACQHTNPQAVIERPVRVVAPAHAKVRRGGYDGSQTAMTTWLVPTGIPVGTNRSGRIRVAGVWLSSSWSKTNVADRARGRRR